jgi:flagellar hook protein FlgE
MSLFGAMKTAISGLNAQASAVSNISGNIANSQTAGYKRLDTAFEDMVIQSGVQSANAGGSRSWITGGVSALARGTTEVQGAITQSDNPLSLALSGRGFISVARPTSESPDGTLAFDSQAAFTRAGDFTINRGGYLINSSGYALRGWTADAAGRVDPSVLRPIVVDRSDSVPQPTTQVTLRAQLPADPPNPTPTMASTVTIHDSLGIERQVVLNWTRLPGTTAGTFLPDQWRLTVTADGEIPIMVPGVGGSAPTTPPARTVDLQFGQTASTNPVPAGTLGRFVNASSSLTMTAYSADAPATATMRVDYGQGPQTITIDLGRFGSTTGLTQTGQTEYRVMSIAQNGASSSPFNFVSFAENGDIEANYQNGNRQVIGRVPVITFANSDALERLDGQAFGETRESGAPLLGSPSSSGAGRFVISAVESSNVDLASEFSKLIVAQRAYTGNTRVVTTADQMLLEPINIIR